MSDISNKTRDELTSISATYRDAKTTFEVQRDRWHEKIVEAIDAGARPAEVGKIVGVTPQRVLAIVARVYSQPA